MRKREDQPLAVVTGAATGIGAATARALDEEGWRIAAVGRRADRLAELVETLSCATAHSTDLADATQTLRAVEEIVERHGPSIDLLVNNAGQRPDRVLTSQPFAAAAEQWQRQLDANLTTAFNAAFMVAPYLRRPGGRIVNIGSMAAQTGGRRAGSVAYAAAKAAVHGMTLGLSRELAPQGITVNTVVPGFVWPTEFTGSWAPELVDEFVADIPVGRAGRPEDIAQLIVYLASREASFLTAAAISANGGMVPTR